MVLLDVMAQGAWPDTGGLLCLGFGLSVIAVLFGGSLLITYQIGYSRGRRSVLREDERRRGFAVVPRDPGEGARTRHGQG